jgi:GH25 family lysozyme M1 (1,4-beta-N-acetylmuramidase)
MGTEGIDVAWPQGAHFPWEFERGKIAFGMAKATEGTGLTDPDFGHNWDSMWWLRPDHRLPRFAYHFFRAAEDPVAQAVHFTSVVKAHGLLPGDNLVMDLEVSDGLEPAGVAARGVTFLRTVNELAPGHRVLVYTMPSFAEAGNCAGMGSWYLWIANYDVQRPAVPAPWKDWTFWQCGDSPVDTDVYKGTGEQLLEFCRMPDRR